MDYRQAVDYLYSATPQFQQIGAAAYKPGLGTVTALSALTGDSHRRYPVIHVAGTNGKGSTSHALAAILQSAGYKVGLFTSPHLVDFRERIRVDGAMISEEAVVEWLANYIDANAGLQPSFFELTTVMAFDYFARENVDVAVVEVGLGGRLDSTNIVTPILSVITNVSKDHVAQLGNTLESIAREKAGIIKPGVPVVLGEGDVPEVRAVIEARAKEVDAPLTIASDKPLVKRVLHADYDDPVYLLSRMGYLLSDLTGNYQRKNINTVLHATKLLQNAGWNITIHDIKGGLGEVGYLTGLKGRWMVLKKNPLVVCDTGHNEGGWRYLSERLKSHHGPLKMVIGFVNDKDIDTILAMMPVNAEYFFTRASVPRALPAEEVGHRASAFGLKGECYGSVSEAYGAALRATESDPDAMVFIGGSTFVVADLLQIKDL